MNAVGCVVVNMAADGIQCCNRGLILAAAAASAEGEASLSAEELAEVYDLMLTHGFREAHVQQACRRGPARSAACIMRCIQHAQTLLHVCVLDSSAIFLLNQGSIPTPSPVLFGPRGACKRYAVAQAVFKEGAVAEEAALDWLCVHVDAAGLPRRFAGAARSLAAGAGIRVVAKADEEAAAAQTVWQPMVTRPFPSVAPLDILYTEQSQH